MLEALIKALVLVAMVPVSSVIAQDTQPLARLWNGRDHFYTASCEEAWSAQANSGYVYEGTAGYIATAPAAGLVPLHRLFNGSDHLYTTDAAEVQSAERGGYSYEGIAGYLPASTQAGTMRLYRLYNPAIGDHFYTASATEHSRAQPTWQPEPPVLYLWSSGRSCPRFPFVVARNDDESTGLGPGHHATSYVEVHGDGTIHGRTHIVNNVYATGFDSHLFVIVHDSSGAERWRQEIPGAGHLWKAGCPLCFGGPNDFTVSWSTSAPPATIAAAHDIAVVHACGNCGVTAQQVAEAAKAVATVLPLLFP